MVRRRRRSEERTTSIYCGEDGSGVKCNKKVRREELMQNGKRGKGKRGKERETSGRREIFGKSRKVRVGVRETWLGDEERYAYPVEWYQSEEGDRE
jgi:hypothetical protein